MCREPFRCNTEHCARSNNDNRYDWWHCNFIKPAAFVLIATLMAFSVSHLFDKYSASISFRIIKSDLASLRAHITTLSMEVNNMLDTRDELRSKLREVNIVMPKMTEAVTKLRTEFSEDIGHHTNALLKAVSLESVKDMIVKELQKYDADKTGRTDYALENSGASILSTRNTESYTEGEPVLTIFGIPLCQQQNTPRAVIQTGTLPGECWAFKGSKGTVVIELLGPVYITGVSLEHISALISPTGDVSAAPKDFSISGLTHENDKNGNVLGKFTYEIDGPSVQYFEIQKIPGRAYKIVELKIHSNHGHKDYTCVYRIRVHGILRQ